MFYVCGQNPYLVKVRGVMGVLPQWVGENPHVIRDSRHKLLNRKDELCDPPRCEEVNVIALM